MGRKSVLITGTSSGIGKATAELFAKIGYDVHGIDIQPSTINLKHYTHWVADVGYAESLPDIPIKFNIVVNNAGELKDEAHRVLRTNIVGYANIANKYCFQDSIEAVVNVASISAHFGIEPWYYVASQGARIAFTKWLCLELGKRYKARVNSLSMGQVVTNLETEYFEGDKELMKKVAEENLLKRWSDPDEMAQWIYFISVINKSMTGQDIIIDNGEMQNYNFVRSEEIPS